MSTEEEEARKIAEMGKPVLGEHSRLEVVIEESYEFKVTVENIESSQCIFYFILFIKESCITSENSEISEPIFNLI